MFNQGLRVKEKVPPLSLTTDEDYGSKFLDTLAGRGLLFIVSKRLMELLQSLGLENLQFFPLVVKDFASRTKHDYWICNVVGLVACLDRGRCDAVWRKEDPSSAFILRKIALDESSIAAANKGKKPSDQIRLFRIKESSKFLVASDEIRKAAMSAGITGIEFRKPEESGDFL